MKITPDRIEVPWCIFCNEEKYLDEVRKYNRDFRCPRCGDRLLWRDFASPEGMIRVTGEQDV